MSVILIADDHPLFREALKGCVARLLPHACILEADSAEALFAIADLHPDADLLLLDLNMPGAQGFSALVYLRATQPQLPIVIVSAREEPQTVQRAIDHGAAGFIPKSASVAILSNAIDVILGGGEWSPTRHGKGAGVEEIAVARRVCDLTPQQFRVLALLGEGLLNKQIAQALRVSEATIKAHMTAILRKLGASNRTQAVLMVRRLAADPAMGHPLQEES